MMTRKLLRTTNSKAISLIRLMTGTVFFAEGLQKFLYPALRGVGRFERMGFPAPEFWGNFTGALEVAAGLLLLLGFYTRLSALITLTVMTAAIAITKVPVAFGESFGPFVLRDLEYYGLLSAVHEGRTDIAMWVCSLFLIIKGGGAFSIDEKLSKKKSAQ